MSTLDDLRIVLREGTVVGLGRFEAKYEKALKEFMSAKDDLDDAMVRLQRELEFLGDEVPAVVQSRDSIIESMNSARALLRDTSALARGLRTELKP